MSLDESQRLALFSAEEIKGETQRSGDNVRDYFISDVNKYLLGPLWTLNSHSRALSRSYVPQQKETRDGLEQRIERESRIFNLLIDRYNHAVYGQTCRFSKSIEAIISLT